MAAQQPSDQSPSSISTVHPDILKAHVLTRLDGPTLASLSCTTPELRSTIAAADELWRNICAATWPSTNHPELSSLIPTFTHGHRSFFSDSFPAAAAGGGRSGSITRLISAVDIHYGETPIFSKVAETEMEKAWFQTSPFRVEMLEEKEAVPTGVRGYSGRGKGNHDEWVKQLKEGLRVSWIVIDPKGKRSVNVSSGVAVSVRHHWLTGEVQLKFSTVVAGESTTECAVVVICGGEGGGEVHVREVFLVMEDMEGRSLCGEEGFRVLAAAMGGERRRRRRGEGKAEYEKLVEMKRELKRCVERRERVLDSLCVVFGVGFFVSFLAFVLSFGWKG